MNLIVRSNQTNWYCLVSKKEQKRLVEEDGSSNYTGASSFIKKLQVKYRANRFTTIAEIDDDNRFKAIREQLKDYRVLQEWPWYTVDESILRSSIEEASTYRNQSTN